jgi:metal transporter CNNM
MGSLQSVNLDAMLRHTFIPDYTVRAITEVFYVRIKRSLYLAAKRATLMERAKKDTQSEDHFDDEVEKVSIFSFHVDACYSVVWPCHDVSSALE